jgi:hypothetical protein
LTQKLRKRAVSGQKLNKVSTDKKTSPTSLAFPGCHFFAGREKSGKKREISATPARYRRRSSGTEAGQKRDTSATPARHHRQKRADKVNNKIFISKLEMITNFRAGSASL